MTTQLEPADFSNWLMIGYGDMHVRFDNEVKQNGN